MDQTTKDLVLLGSLIACVHVYESAREEFSMMPPHASYLSKLYEVLRLIIDIYVS